MIWHSQDQQTQRTFHSTTFHISSSKSLEFLQCQILKQSYEEGQQSLNYS